MSSPKKMSLEHSSLFQLTATRLKLTLREPEAIFWIFVFPILLAIGLGIAFRNRPADVLPVGATTAQLTQALAADTGLKATEMDESAGVHALAVGTILLLAEQRGDGVAYRYDNTNPDARTARMIADRAIEVAAGRKDVVTAENELVHETGSRYIDFVVPGLLGMNLMGSAMWGLGFSIVDGRQKKLLKRMVASPMPRWQFLAGYLLSRLVMLAIEVVFFLGICQARVWRAVSRAVVAARAPLCFGLACLFSPRTAGGVAGEDHGGGERVDEPCDVSHVDFVGSVFLGIAISGDDSAAGARAAVDGGDRCIAREHAARRSAKPLDGAGGNYAGVVFGSVCGVAEDFPLAVRETGTWD